MDKYFINYFSGYMEGDGCWYVGTFIQKKSSTTVFRCNIQISSVKKASLILFKERYGGHISHKKRIKPQKDIYVWTISGFKACNLARQCIKHLPTHDTICQLFIDLYTSIKSTNYQKVPTEIFNYRLSLIDKIRMEIHMKNWVTKEYIDQIKNEKLTMTPTEEDYAYLAGLMDSEGCFRVSKYKVKNKPNPIYQIVVEVGNTKSPILKFLINHFGGSLSYVAPRKKGKYTSRASATWCISASALSKILPKILPYLVIKKEVCEVLIEFYKTTLPNGGDRHSEAFRIMFEKRREIRDQLVHKIHKLNKKGQ